MLAVKSCWACVSGHKFDVDLSPPKDIVDLFKKYAENDVMRVEQFQRFSLEVQGEKISEAEAEAIMSSEKASVWDKLSRSKFTLDTFYSYLFSEKLNPPINSEVHHDMKLPLSYYFIYTGHNSYLTGNQLSSDCSEKPIVAALRRGVRVIELDLWPSSSKDSILVLHGRTLTTPVEFETCIVAIKENAFVSSDFPVVITFEDHLPAILQSKAAEIVNRVLGDALYYPDSNQEGFQEFPSPEQLKKRIIISTKPPKEYLASQNSNVSEVEVPTSAEEKKEVEQEAPWGDDLWDVSQEFPSPEKNLSGSFKPPNELDSDDDENKPPEKRHESKVAPEYKRIITIRAGKPRGDSLKDALAGDDIYARRVSLSEPQLSKLVKSNPNTIVSFTKRNILRVYPKGTRVDSSNYNPLQAWAHGAQMVAFNMQGYGRPLWLVHGLFRANGGCGYVKKPDFLIDGNSEEQLSRQAYFDPMNPGPVKKTLKVKVYAGQGWLQRFGKTHFDRFSPPDFYTRIGIAGVKADTIMKNTETKMDKWVPHWEEEFEFPLTVPELALVRVEVHEYDAAGKDDFGGQTCFPVEELKPGIRAVPLHDKKGNELSPVRLLLHFTFVT